MTTLSTTADLLRLLREDPDFRDEVRSLLLSQDLIELPERFARFEAYVERQFTEIRADVAQNTRDITDNTSDIGALRGAEYEDRVRRSFASYASMSFSGDVSDRSMRRNRLLSNSNILGRDSAGLRS